MRLVLVLISGIAWTMVYIESIRVGVKDKSYAMPLWALGLNFAWEVIHSILGIMHFGIGAQPIVNLIWAICDIGLLYTFFKYGYRHFSDYISKKQFVLYGVLVLAMSFAFQLLFLVEFNNLEAATYSAYLQNLLMSALFISFLVIRKSSIGQSKLIAWSKFIGIVAPTIQHGILGENSTAEPNLFVLGIGSHLL